MKHIDAYQTEAVVDATASLRLSELPFANGERVQVFILRIEEKSPSHQGEEDVVALLKGSVLRDDDPFGPATPIEDWEAEQ